MHSLVDDLVPVGLNLILLEVLKRSLAAENRDMVCQIALGSWLDKDSRSHIGNADSG